MNSDMYVNGKLHGKFIGHYKGRISCEIGYWHGEKHGLCVTYCNGIVSTKMSFKHGILHGERIMYHEGKIVSHELYVDGISVHDFLAKPLNEDERLLLSIKHSVKFYE